MGWFKQFVRRKEEERQRGEEEPQAPILKEDPDAAENAAWRAMRHEQQLRASPFGDPNRGERMIDFSKMPSFRPFLFRR